MVETCSGKLAEEVVETCSEVVIRSGRLEVEETCSNT